MKCIEKVETTKRNETPPPSNKLKCPKRLKLDHEIKKFKRIKHQNIDNLDESDVDMEEKEDVKSNIDKNDKNNQKEKPKASPHNAIVNLDHFISKYW